MFSITLFLRHIEFLCQQLPGPVQSSRGGAGRDRCSEGVRSWAELSQVHLWDTGVMPIMHSNATWTRAWHRVDTRLWSRSVICRTCTKTWSRSLQSSTRGRTASSTPAVLMPTLDCLRWMALYSPTVSRRPGQTEKTATSPGINLLSHQVLLGPDDAVLSDELNHASIIDGIRLCRAKRLRYKHMDLGDLENRLKEAQVCGAPCSSLRWRMERNCCVLLSPLECAWLWLTESSPWTETWLLCRESVTWLNSTEPWCS